jgi:hypothetical protein
MESHHAPSARHAAERSALSATEDRLGNYLAVTLAVLRTTGPVPLYSPPPKPEGPRMPEDTPTPTRIDLSTYTEATRRAVYDAVVAIYFSPTPEEIAAAEADPEATRPRGSSAGVS